LNPTLIASFLGNDSAYSESYAQIVLLRQQSPIICVKYLVAGMLGGTKWASIHHKSGSFVVDPIAKELNPSLEASPRSDNPPPRAFQHSTDKLLGNLKDYEQIPNIG
jgi:hypothetical protein